MSIMLFIILFLYVVRGLQTYSFFDMSSEKLKKMNVEVEDQSTGNPVYVVVYFTRLFWLSSLILF